MGTEDEKWLRHWDADMDSAIADAEELSPVQFGAAVERIIRHTARDATEWELQQVLRRAGLIDKDGNPTEKANNPGPLTKGKAFQLGNELLSTYQDMLEYGGMPPEPMVDEHGVELGSLGDTWRGDERASWEERTKKHFEPLEEDQLGSLTADLKAMQSKSKWA